MSRRRRRVSRSAAPKALAGLLAVVLIAALVLARHAGWISWGGPDADDRQRYHDRWAKVLFVVDGDTVHVDIPDPSAKRNADRTKIRLRGIDAPEVAHGSRPATYFGPEARDWLRGRLNGRRVRVELDLDRESRDRYGRLLAFLWVQRSDEQVLVNEQIAAAGYAYYNPRYPCRYSERIRSAQQLARSTRQGLWAAVRQDQIPAYVREGVGD
jgi:micrococcal nuclease